MPTELLATIATHNLQNFTKLLNNFWLNNTQWYDPSLADIYVRALSTHYSVIQCLKWYSSLRMGNYVHVCLHALVLHACMCMYACVLMGDVCTHYNTGKITLAHCIYTTIIFALFIVYLNCLHMCSYNFYFQVHIVYYLYHNLISDYMAFTKIALITMFDLHSPMVV